MYKNDKCVHINNIQRFGREIRENIPENLTINNISEHIKVCYLNV